MHLILSNKFWVLLMPLGNMVRFQFLAQLLVDHHLCLILYFFCASLLHSFIMWLFYSFESFFHKRQLMVFYWSLSDIKSSQVSKILVSILANLNNGVVWMVLLVLLFPSPLALLPILWWQYRQRQLQLVLLSLLSPTVFFSSLARSTYLYLFLLSFSFTLWSAKTTKTSVWRVLFFLLTITRSDRLAAITSSVCSSKSQRSLCASFSRTDSGLCIYHLFVWFDLNFLHNS